MWKFGWLLALLVMMVGLLPSCKEKRGELKRIWYNGSYNRDFNDLNAAHLEAARKIGIEPVASREEAEHASKKMVEVRTNEYYRGGR